MVLFKAETSQFTELVKLAVQEVFAESLPSPMETQKEQKEIFNLSEASEFTGLAKQTIYGYKSKGKLHGCGGTRKLLFRRQELVDFLNIKNFNQK